MGKRAFEGLASMVTLVGRLLEGETLTAASIAASLGVQHAAGARRVTELLKLPGAIGGAGKERSARLAKLMPRPAVGRPRWPASAWSPAWPRHCTRPA